MSVDLTISMVGYGEASTVLGNWFRFMFCTKYSAAGVRNPTAEE